jgi:hypothetical protein
VRADAAVAQTASRKTAAATQKYSCDYAIAAACILVPVSIVLQCIINRGRNISIAARCRSGVARYTVNISLPLSSRPPLLHSSTMPASAGLLHGRAAPAAHSRCATRAGCGSDASNTRTHRPRGGRSPWRVGGALNCGALNCTC